MGQRMKQFAKLALSIAVVIGLGFTAANAMAVTSTLDTPISFDAQHIAGFSDTIVNGFTDFNDLFSFSAPSGLGGASVISSFNGLNFSTAFSSFQLLDLSHGNTVLATGSISPNFFGQLSFPGLSVGINYGLNIIGTVNNPAAGAFYSGSVTISPVPEPDEYVLMLCGLLLIGFIATRRKSENLSLA